MVVLDDHLGAPDFAPMERWKTMEDLVAKLDVEGILPRFEEAVLREIERRAGKTPPRKVIRPIEDYLGATDFDGLQELSTVLPPLAPSDALAGLDAVIRSEVERRDGGAAHGTGR